MAGELRPLARTEKLVVEELPDEILVYDLKRHKAHCLNRTAAVVWRHCDGNTTLAQMATLLERKTELPEDARIVEYAVDRLQKAKLLEEGTNMPTVAAGHSRRELVKRLAFGGLAIMLPAVTTMVAPVAAMQASTTTNNDCRNSCIGVGLPCRDRPGRVCKQRIRKGVPQCRCR